ncbi:MAG: protein kinase, partial [Deltaproteobacteria bacterium]|nr:protein kinase [Deltaproteobacteria bacterium]
MTALAVSWAEPRPPLPTLHAVDGSRALNMHFDPVSKLVSPTGVSQELGSVPGEILSRFEITAPFARGACGVLYDATDTTTGATGLLKLLHPELTSSLADRQKLRRELGQQANLRASLLARVLAVGDAGDRLWVFREKVEGESLAVRLDRISGGRLGAPGVLHLAAELASALDELHRAGLLHRDLKPGHVIVSGDDAGALRIRLIDAGIHARATSEGVFDAEGTPAYASPEQAAGKLVSFRSDLYSLGCVLYECASGMAPFGREPADAVLRAHLESPPPSFDAQGMPEAAATLLSSLLAKELRDRPFSAAQLRRSLDPFLAPGAKAVVAAPARDASGTGKSGLPPPAPRRAPGAGKTILGMPAPGSPSHATLRSGGMSSTPATDTSTIHGMPVSSIPPPGDAPPVAIPAPPASVPPAPLAPAALRGPGPRPAPSGSVGAVARSPEPTAAATAPSSGERPRSLPPPPPPSTRARPASETTGTGIPLPTPAAAPPPPGARPRGDATMPLDLQSEETELEDFDDVAETAALPAKAPSQPPPPDQPAMPITAPAAGSMVQPAFLAGASPPSGVEIAAEYAAQIGSSPPPGTLGPGAVIPPPPLAPSGLAAPPSAGAPIPAPMSSAALPQTRELGAALPPTRAMPASQPPAARAYSAPPVAVVADDYERKLRGSSSKTPLLVVGILGFCVLSSVAVAAVGLFVGRGAPAPSVAELRSPGTPVVAAPAPPTVPNVPIAVPTLPSTLPAPTAPVVAPTPPTPAPAPIPPTATDPPVSATPATPTVAAPTTATPPAPSRTPTDSARTATTERPGRRDDEPRAATAPAAAGGASAMDQARDHFRARRHAEAAA